MLAALGYAVHRYVRADDSDSAAGGTAGESGGEPAATDGDSDPDESPPAELLSNEEQVLKLLRENGGRIKQQRVASELDWTAAKTSQVIGGLREDDDVETFRIGRENVVTLPDTDLTDDVDDGPEDQ
ncbi:helix-turn-helix transcriptional regulator [Halomicroarcula sp. GCM10025894]|uniref:helix-turn-helix transcriptional regulator n=1 Tax=Halomicroarcula sp. GCM10025894 TaxID=3252673 RepID=UPI0036222D41